MAKTNKDGKTAFTRVVQDGVVGYTDGATRTLLVPTEEQCRERLTQLLASVKGDRKHPDLDRYWLERARAMCDIDPLNAAWAEETFLRLDKMWDEVIAPPAVTKSVYQ